MKHSLLFKSTFSKGTFTVRACGWKASSTTSVPAAVKRLIEKMYDMTPVDLKVETLDSVIGVATWVEITTFPKKEAA